MARDKIKSGVEVKASVRGEESSGTSPETTVREEVAAEMADLGFSAAETVAAPEPEVSGALHEGDGVQHEGGGAPHEGDGAPQEVVARDAESERDEVFAGGDTSPEVPTILRASSVDPGSLPKVFLRKKRKVLPSGDVVVGSPDTPRGDEGGDVEVVATDTPGVRASVVDTPGAEVGVERTSIVSEETATVVRETEVVREIEREVIVEGEVVLMESDSTVEELLGSAGLAGV